MSLLFFASGAIGVRGVQAAETGAEPTILVVGDSLSAEFGLPRGTGWVALLEARLRARGSAYHVINASVSGETTSGGLARIDELLRVHHPQIVLLELGANDGLRGLPVTLMQKNLHSLVQRSSQGGAKVVLIGMRLPPNFGDDYSSMFHESFADLARSEHLAFVPFLLSGFAEDERWFQADHLHPLAKAEPMILETVWKALAPLLGR